MSQKVCLVFSLAVFLVIAAMAGCGKKEEAQPSQAPVPASQAAPSAAPAAAPVSAGTPLAATDGDIPGIRVAVNELRRSSSAVTLKFIIYNDTDAEFDI